MPRHSTVPIVRLMRLVVPSLLLIPVSAVARADGSWPAFRGPTGLGYTDETELPLRWDGATGEGVIWSSPLVGAGHASPIVDGGRLFVTTARWPDATRDRKQVIPDHLLLCYDASDGRALWTCLIPPGPWRREDFRSGPGGGYAAPTPVTDGERIYCAFGSSVVAAVDRKGRIAWRREILPHTFDVTMGSSPILHGDSLIILCAMAKPSDSRVLALDKRTGATRWERPLPTTKFGHSTPVIIDVAGRQQMLVLASGMGPAPDALKSLDPGSGEVLWWCRGGGDAASPAYASGRVYFDSGRGGPGVCVEPTGRGDVSDTHVRWTVSTVPEGIGSPIIVDDLVYRLHEPGVLKCWELSTGKRVYQKRLPGISTTWASPIADPRGRIFFANAGRSFVVQAGREFRLLATNELGDPNHASPAAAGGRLYLVGTERVHCVGAAESATRSGHAAPESPLRSWKRFTIAKSLPGSSWGTGGIGVADLDRDGDPDIVVSRRETQTAYWLERKSDASWSLRPIGSSESLERALGCAALDLDLDGWADVAFRGVWFRNPGREGLRSKRWEAIPYDGGGHDIIAADVSGDDVPDLVTYDGKALLWFDPADGLTRRTIVAGRDDHGGLAPRGVGDLDGDGDADLVLPGVWLENPGRGVGEWPQHPWPHLPVAKASYGTSMRSWVADVNGDGRLDIVWSDCDTGWSHVYWVENRGEGRAWTRHRLPDPPGDSRTGSFHSLGVADLDGDGRLDIFAGEQEDADTYMTSDGRLAMKPDGLDERGVIWSRSSPTSEDLVPVVIHRGNPGWHDAVLVDIDGDDDLDIVTKIWHADGPGYPVTWWRNDIRGAIRAPGPQASGPPAAPGGEELAPIECPLRKAGVDPTTLKPFEEVAEYVAFLERPDRATWQRPDAVVEALGLEGSETVADVGAGSAYFTFRIARKLPRGRVIAIDTEPEMVRHVHRKVLTEAWRNVRAKLCRPDEPELPEGADLVFVCDVLLHVRERAAWLRKLHAGMRPGARLVLIDFRSGELPEGPPEEIKVPREEVLRLCRRAGFRLSRDLGDLLPYQELLVFTRP